MRLHTLEIENWMGYRGKHTFGLFDKDIIGIIAEYSDDKEASNQAGKTSWVEAIEYALTGKHRAKKETELIHHGEEHLLVHLTLSDGEQQYKITRGRDAKNKGKLTLDWIEKAGEAQKAIDELIGFGKDEFDLMTYFKQGEMTNFMDMESSKQKAYIIKWFNIEHWELLEKAAKEAVSELKKEHAKVKAKIEALSETFENDIDLDTELEVLTDSLATATRKLNSIQKKIKSYQSKVKVSETDYMKAKATIRKQKRRIEEVNEIVAKNHELEDTIAELKPKHKKMKRELTQSVSEAHQNKAQAMQLMENYKGKIQLAKKHKQGLCPILNETCDRIKFSPAQIKVWEKEYYEQKEIKALAHRQVELNMEEARMETRIEKLEAQIQKNEWHGHIADAETFIEEAEKTIKAYDKNAEKKLEQLENLKIDLVEEKEELQNSVTRLKAKIEAKEQNEKRVKKLKIQLKKIANELDDQNYLVLMFGKNGIPSLEIENGFYEVEEGANYTMQLMNKGMELTFKPTRDLNQAEPLCLSCGHQFKKGSRKDAKCPSCGAQRRMRQKDEIVFKVTMNGKDYPYYMDSGGGKAIIALAMRIALTQLKRRLGGANLNVVFLDEPDSALDKRYLRNFVRLVTKTLTKKLGIEQVIWISHHKEIQNQVPHTLKVIRDGNESKARWT